MGIVRGIIIWWAIILGGNCSRENCSVPASVSSHYTLLENGMVYRGLSHRSKDITLMSLIFAGTKFRRFRGLGGHPRNLIPAK